MTINSLKELDKLMMLCRRRGIQSIEIDGMKFVIDLSSPEPRVKKPAVAKNATVLGPFDPTAGERIEMPDELTDEQRLFWSAPNLQTETA